MELRRRHNHSVTKWQAHTPGHCGLIIAGVGLAQVSTPTLEASREVRAHGIPVVVSSLVPQKAHVLMMVAMTNSTDPEELRRYFDR